MTSSSRSKAPPAGHASKPPAASRNKNNTAPRNINLDDDEENILPERTRNERPRSSKQAQLDAEAMEKQMASMAKQLKAYKKVKRQQEKNAGASNGSTFDDEEEYESEEEDPPSGNGYFAQSVKSLGTVTSSAVPGRRLRKYNEACPFEDINNIFNAPASVALRGRSTEPTPLRDEQHRSPRASVSLSPPPPLRQHNSSAHQPPIGVRAGRHSSSASPPPRMSSPHHLSESTASRTHHQRKHGRSTSRSPSTAPCRKLLKCEWRNGVAPTGRPGARDYELEVSGLILQAIREFEVRVVTQDPLPLPDKQTSWVSECWTHACAKNDKGYELPDRIIGLIRVRTSNARAPLKDAVRPRVEAAFQFIKTNSPDSKQGRRNQQNYRNATKNNAFVYKDREKLSGLYETKLISEVIQDAFFKNNKSLGVEFPDYFNPITLVTIALILTAIEFNINEWKSGVFVQAAFDEKSIGDRFKSHLNGLHKWRKGAPVVVDKICEKLFKRAMRNTGGSVIEETSRISEDAQRRAQQELATRTGETDSEEEGPDCDDEEEDWEEELEYQEPAAYGDEELQQGDGSR